MEFVELLKILNSQTQQADTQAQIKTLHDIDVALYHGISLIFWLLASMIIALEILNLIMLWRFDRRLKKVEEMLLQKPG